MKIFKIGVPPIVPFLLPLLISANSLNAAPFQRAVSFVLPGTMDFYGTNSPNFPIEIPAPPPGTTFGACTGANSGRNAITILMSGPDFKICGTSQGPRTLVATACLPGGNYEIATRSELRLIGGFNLGFWMLGIEPVGVNQFSTKIDFGNHCAVPGVTQLVNPYNVVVIFFDDTSRYPNPTAPVVTINDAPFLTGQPLPASPIDITGTVTSNELVDSVDIFITRPNQTTVTFFTEITGHT